MSEHTKTPWKRMGHVIYIGSPWSCDAETGEPLWGGFSLQHCPNAEANARHIVHCVNNHERLVDQLKDCLELMEDSERRYEQGQDSPNMNDEIKYTRELLAALEAEKGGEL